MTLGGDFALSDAKAFTQCVEGLAEFGERVVVCFHIVFILRTHRGVSLHVAVIIWAFKDLPPRLKPPTPSWLPRYQGRTTFLKEGNFSSLHVNYG